MRGTAGRLLAGLLGLTALTLRPFGAGFFVRATVGFLALVTGFALCFAAFTALRVLVCVGRAGEAAGFPSGLLAALGLLLFALAGLLVFCCF